MNRDEDAKNVRLYDVRVVERNIKKGLITRKDVEKHHKALPDVTDKICPPNERSPELTGVYGSLPYRPPAEEAPRAEPSAIRADTGADEGDEDDEADEGDEGDEGDDEDDDEGDEGDEGDDEDDEAAESGSN